MIKFCTFVFLLTAAVHSFAFEARVVSLESGDTAPVFVATDDQGKPWNSIDHIGRQVVVVYFYPADLTSGCTRQACGFQKRLAELRKAGTTVVGVSGDSTGNHQLFKKVHSLNFSLLADENGKVARAFGVPTREGGQITRVVKGEQKTLIRGVTAQRWTFVIGLDGSIVHKNTRVNAEDDGDAVLKVVRQLTASTQ